jgi:hypothetical protein
MKKLMLGPCIESIKWEHIKKLLRLAQNKIKVLFDDDVLRKVMEKDNSEFLE